MADKSWKAFERRIAKLFGCKRRGADFRGENGGKDDLTHAHYAVECKLLSRLTFGELTAACIQAEGAARAVWSKDLFEAVMDEAVAQSIPKSREPIAIVKKKGAPDDDALVIQRLATFKAWHL